MTTNDRRENDERIRGEVRQGYARVATGGSSGCCGVPGAMPAREFAAQIGYAAEELAAVPEGANMGLSCGNPALIAALKPGEVVLDLGSGGGFDVFQAGPRVGAAGRVIGVDMTPEMIALARGNAAKVGLDYVDFRLGTIEQLPVDDASIDVIMSNCVINLAPDKPAVFREAYRVLAPGGRLAISDMVAVGDLPAAIANDPAAYTGCIAGAAPVVELERMIADAGFEQVRIRVQASSRDLVEDWSPGSGAAQVVASALIEAIKPA